MCRIRSTRMPIRPAASSASAVARIALPVRVRRRKYDSATRTNTVTTMTSSRFPEMRMPATSITASIGGATRRRSGP